MNLASLFLVGTPPTLSSQTSFQRLQNWWKRKKNYKHKHVELKEAVPAYNKGVFSY